MIPSSINGDIDVPASVDAQGNVHIGHQIVHNYYVSTDWQKLQQRLTDALENYQSFPEHPKFAQQLQTVQDEIESFKRDVVKLARDFQKIPLNTERLKQAKAYFDQGDYEKARGVLDTEALGQEQEALLAEKDAVETKLAANADEFMLLAHLTAMNFDLGEERISKACEAFESALKVAGSREADCLCTYALFLQEENLFLKAERLYREGLRIYKNLQNDHNIHCEEKIAGTLNNLATIVLKGNTRNAEAENLLFKSLNIYKNLATYQFNNHEHAIADVLNNLANLLSLNPNKILQAENFYRESLSIYKTLTTSKLGYEPDIASVLSNLASLLSKIERRENEAENLYQESLKIQRNLEINIFNQSQLAHTLNNLGNLLSKNNNRSDEAESFYYESIKIYRQLSTLNPFSHSTNLANISNNLANLITKNASRQDEALSFFQDSLEIYRILSLKQPSLYIPQTARVLASLGDAHMQWQEPLKALPYLQESLDIYQRLHTNYPPIYNDYYNYVSILMKDCRQQLISQSLVTFSIRLTHISNSYILKL